MLELYTQNQNLKTFAPIIDDYVKNNLNNSYKKVYFSNGLKITQILLKSNYIRMQISNDLNFNNFNKEGFTGISIEPL